MPKHFLMCRPEYFTVEYAINPWMDPEAGADREVAIRQWEALKAAYESLGHQVSLIDPIEGLPDMVFAANGATVAGGRVYGARFAFAERGPEGPAYLSWFAERGYPTREPERVNEGEGDFLTLDDYVLAGTGFRTDLAAHHEAQEYLGRPVISLSLVDPRFYHLDTALFSLDGRNVAYYPGRSRPAARKSCAGCSPTRYWRARPTPRCSASTRSATARTSSSTPRPPTSSWSSSGAATR